jgi:hypothetical protein
MKKQTLEQILADVKENVAFNGSYGLNACKEHIAWVQKVEGKSLYKLLEEYVENANKDTFFNKTMVLACWEMINAEV